MEADVSEGSVRSTSVITSVMRKVLKSVRLHRADKTHIISFLQTDKNGVHYSK